MDMYLYVSNWKINKNQQNDENIDKSKNKNYGNRIFLIQNILVTVFYQPFLVDRVFNRSNINDYLSATIIQTITKQLSDLLLCHFFASFSTRRHQRAQKRFHTFNIVVI